MVASETVFPLEIAYICPHPDKSREQVRNSVEFRLFEILLPDQLLFFVQTNYQITQMLP